MNQIREQEVIVDGRVVPKYKAIVDCETEQVYSIVSNKYKVLSHDEALNPILETLEKGNHGRFAVETILSKNDARMFTTITLRDYEVSVGSRDDVVCPQIIVKNSYDLSFRYSVEIGAFRFVCSNGLVVGRRFDLIKRKHYNIVIPTQDQISRRLDDAYTIIKEESERWKRWQDRLVTPRLYENIIDTLDLPQKGTKEIEEEVEKISTFTHEYYRTLTMWALFNILTAHITHNVAKVAMRAKLNDRLRKATMRL